MLALIVSAMTFLCHELNAQQKDWWGKTEYKGAPWVTNSSSVVSAKYGLTGKHLSLWASHGRYYSPSAGIWKWQRMNFFGTNEDLFTQTFVVPYLIPMLEKAGANVFTPRERDWQTHEVIVDNDEAMMMVDGKILHGAVTNYVEDGKWDNYVTSGFLVPYHGVVYDGDTPFAQGTSKVTKTKKKKSSSFVIYTPKIPQEGRYAVYVSYQTLDKSVDDARYIVVHRGIETHFKVNQQMGGGTWVYLGTFDFSEGESMDNCVIVDNMSSSKGVVTTDAVRFGGGMGNTVRGNTTSGLPRCLEGARYYAEWAGAPYSVYSTRQGSDDYSDDINVRSLMTNWIAGGSVFAPDKAGKKVPIELSLAIHSDAGYNRDMKSLFGSLGICTTDFNDGRLGSGHSRIYSRDFVELLLRQVESDMKALYGRWNVRDLYDRNYSETRLPAMPSAIIELLSHQSFPDMKFAHDPLFKFNVSRSIYKAILRFVTASHGGKCVVTPLQPKKLRVSMEGKGKAQLSWIEQDDPLEPTARAKSYVVYTSIGNDGFDNGVVVKGNTFTTTLRENTLYKFRVSALNDGGESFLSEEMAAYYNPQAQKQVVVVNGFHRLASPALKYSSVERIAGFDLNEDPGVSYGLAAGWVGNQQVYSMGNAGSEGPGSFGYSGNELVGRFIAGNEFNYVTEHVDAIASSGEYSVVTCSSECIGTGKDFLNEYPLIDLLLGNERNDGYSLGKFTSLPVEMRNALQRYHGALLVSGSYIASDNVSPNDSSFIANLLHIDFRAQNRDRTSVVNGMGTAFDVWRDVNSQHYASSVSDVLGVPGVADSLLLTLPSTENLAFVAMTYSDNSPAAIAYKDDHRRTFAMGFPLECIRQRKMKSYVMRGILNFLLK